MDKVRLGSLTTEIEVTDADALLSPQVLARILAAVEARLEEKARDAELRAGETGIGRAAGGVR